VKVNLRDWEEAARAQLDPMAWGYYASGARDQITLSENQAAFRRIALHYKVMVDVSNRSTATTVLGTPVSTPILVAPTAFHKLAHPGGEVATAKGASAADTVMVLSTLSNTDMEDVVAASARPVWFQLYIYKDRGATRALVERAEAAGCEALVLTVDAPLLGTREQDVKNRFRLPDGLGIRNMQAAGFDAMDTPAMDSGLAEYVKRCLDQALTWADIDWLRSITRLPVLVKGIVRADDARRAVDHGAQGIVVSNHGGRQLDTSPATISVLPAIADAVGDRVDVLLDGGIRRGTDVIKALAFGATAVLIGRPILWGLAVDGAEGVAGVLAQLTGEVDQGLALCGCPTIADVGRDLVMP
jgi:4-hydroxymandelate oxidase